MKKKIIFVTQALWIGGIETALVNLLNRLDYEKYDVSCLIVRGCLDVADRIKPRCRLIVADRERAFTFREPYRYSRLYHLTEESQNPSWLHRAMMWTVPAIKWLENRLFIRYIRQQMKSEHFDICVIYSDVVAETAVRAVCADKYLMFYHHGAMRRVYHDEIGYRRSEKIIAVSHNQEEKLRRFRPKYEDKMMTIQNLTVVGEIRRKAEAPIRESFRADQFNIVTCGRVSWEKGMDLVVEACAKLVKDGYDDIHWWIVGGGPAEAELRKKISLVGMETYVSMVGMVDNPYPYIKQADLYVQPSRAESFGLTIAEAMVLGKYVISTDTDGAQELIKDGENGTICLISSDAIADSISNFMRSNASKEYIRVSNIGNTNFEERNALIMQRINSLFDGVSK